MISSKGVFCLVAVSIVLTQPACSSQPVNTTQFKPWNDDVAKDQESFEHFMVKQSWLSEAIRVSNKKGANSFINNSEKYYKSIYEVIRTAIADCALKRNEYAKCWRAYGAAYDREQDDFNKSAIVRQNLVEFDVTPDQLQNGYERKHWNAFILYNFLNHFIYQEEVINRGEDPLSECINNVKNLAVSYAKSKIGQNRDFLKAQLTLIDLAAGDIKRYVEELDLVNYLTELKKDLDDKASQGFLLHLPNVNVIKKFEKKDIATTEQGISQTIYSGAFSLWLPNNMKNCQYVVREDGRILYYEVDYGNKQLGQKSGSINNQNNNFVNNSENFYNNNQNNNFNTNNQNNMYRNNNVSFNNNRGMPSINNFNNNQNISFNNNLNFNNKNFHINRQERNIGNMPFSHNPQMNFGNRNNNLNFGNNNQNNNFVNNNRNIYNNNQNNNFGHIPYNNNNNQRNVGNQNLKNQNIGCNIQQGSFNNGQSEKTSNKFLQQIREELKEKYWNFQSRQSGTEIRNLCHSIPEYNLKTNTKNKDYENMTANKCYFNSTMQVLANSRPIIQRARKFKELEKKGQLQHLRSHIRDLTSAVSDIMLSTYNGNMDGAKNFVFPLDMPNEAIYNQNHPAYKNPEYNHSQFDETPVQKYCEAILKIQQASGVQDQMILENDWLPTSLRNVASYRRGLQHWMRDQSAGYTVQDCLDEIMPMLSEGLKFGGQEIALIQCNTDMMRSEEEKTKYRYEYLNGGSIQIPKEYFKQPLQKFLYDRYEDQHNPNRREITHLPNALLFTSEGHKGSNNTIENLEVIYPETFKLKCGGKTYTYQINGYVYCLNKRGGHFMPCLRTKDGWYTINDLSKDKHSTKLMDEYKHDFEQKDSSGKRTQHKLKELASYELISIK